MQSRQALNLARDQGLDLVMVSPTAQPPVCKIIDFGKFKYLTEKQKKDSKSKSQDVKGIKISPRIAEHDLIVQLKKSIKFLEEGHKVKITCQFRAREITHPELGKRKLDRMAEDMANLAVVERPPTLDGKLMIMVMVPKPATKAATKAKQNAQAENKQDSRKAVQDNGKRKDHPAEVGEQPPVPAQEREPEATA